MTAHLLRGHELQHLLGVQPQERRLVPVRVRVWVCGGGGAGGHSGSGGGGGTEVQLTDTLSHQKTSLHCVVELTDMDTERQTSQTGTGET